MVLLTNSPGKDHSRLDPITALPAVSVPSVTWACLLFGKRPHSLGSSPLIPCWRGLTTGLSAAVLRVGCYLDLFQMCQNVTFFYLSFGLIGGKTSIELPPDVPLNWHWCFWNCSCCLSVRSVGVCLSPPKSCHVKVSDRVEEAVKMSDLHTPD